MLSTGQMWGVFLLLIVGAIMGGWRIRLAESARRRELKDLFLHQGVVERRIAELWCLLDNSFNVQISIQRGDFIEHRERQLAAANATVKNAKAKYMSACRVAEREGYGAPVNHLQAESLARRFGLLDRGTGLKQ